jgi:outer membrane protein OmpA-like peptidoglycan-associated protein
MKTKILSISVTFVAILLSSCAYYHPAGTQVAAALEQNHIATTQVINYDVNSARIDSESAPVLDSVIQYLESNPTAHIEISVSTNNINDTGLIPPNSLERAESVKAYIVASGIDPNRIIAVETIVVTK